MTSKKCAICDAAEAKTPCGNCFAIFYCCKEHQEKDRGRHKCNPYKIEFSDKLGRYLISTRDIKPGEVILRETPAVVGPRVDSNLVCLGCHVTIPRENHSVCSNCRVAPICSPACGLKPPHADRECKFYQEKLKGVNVKFLSSNFQVVTPFRCLMLKETDLWENFINLESHLEERLNDPVCKFYQEKIYSVLKAADIVGAGDEALVQRICAILDINSFEVREPGMLFEKGERLRGIYLKAALMSHDCISNTHLSVDDYFVMTVRASVAIGKGEPILFNYASPLEATAQRLQRLREGKYFTCTCKRCCDPKEFGTYMGSIKCPRCQNGIVIPTNPISPQTDWYCSGCKHKFHDRLIKTTISQGLNLIESNDTNDYRDLEVLLKKVLKTFPEKSVVVVELKQKLLALLQDTIIKDLGASMNVLKLQSDLCQDIIEIINSTEPGLSRLKGVTLQELYRTKLLIANKQFEAREIPMGEYLDKLRECEKILKEAISILIYEPAHSPEGRLLHLALGALKMVRESIMNPLSMS